jgi:hypothetical protein
MLTIVIARAAVLNLTEWRCARRRLAPATFGTLSRARMAQLKETRS